mgnify:CR=1 FL=1
MVFLWIGRHGCTTKGKLHVFVRQANGLFIKCGVVEDEMINPGESYYVICGDDGPIKGRFIRIQQDKAYIYLAEVQVFGEWSHLKHQ